MPLRKIEKMYDRLLKVLMECQLDIKKFDMGNKTAGIRIRRTMQDIRKRARGLRQGIQSVNRIKAKKRLEGLSEEED